MALKPYEHEERLELYNKGLTDEKIGDQLYLSRRTIQAWRAKHSLPTHRPNVPNRDKGEHARRLDLYRQGYSDREIAERLGWSTECIAGWRRRNNLKPNPREKVSDHDKRMELYNKGLTDADVGKKCWATQQAIFMWRKRNNLPAHNPAYGKGSVNCAKGQVMAKSRR